MGLPYDYYFVRVMPVSVIVRLCLEFELVDELYKVEFFEDVAPKGWSIMTYWHGDFWYSRSALDWVDHRRVYWASLDWVVGTHYRERT